MSAGLLRFLPQARADLIEIWDHIAQDNVDAASRFTDLLEEKCQLLAVKPHMGRSRDELEPGLRSFPVGNYVIFYRPIKTRIEVVRILSGARDIPALF